MKDDSDSKNFRKETPFFKGLHRRGSAFHHDELRKEVTGIKEDHRHYRDIKDRLESTFPVFDPRFLGYEFPSYTFIETENNLEEASEEDTTLSRLDDKAQLLGTVLGDVDLIHRRVDEDRWANAKFAKWAKQRLCVFEQFETYPIFEIARWYGKDIKESLEPESNGNSDSNDAKTIRELTPDEERTIQALYEEPGLLELTSDDKRYLDFTFPDVISTFKQNEIEKIITQLKDDEILLGSSATYDINKSPWKCAFMGLSLGTDNGEVDHDNVINELQEPEFGGDDQDDDKEHWDKFTMPFITSGVGQGWADILLELRIKDLGDLDDIAQNIREIGDVKSTKTYLMTDTLINENTPLK